MKLKEGDFLKLDYTGSTDGKVFDTTVENTAKSEGIYREGAVFEPITIVVGAGFLLKGLESQLIGKEDIGQLEVTVKPEEGFGKKNPKLLQIMPASLFIEHKLNVHPGMQINMDGVVGLVKSVSSGRVIVDFNHPLSGRILSYKLDLHGHVTDEAEKAGSIFTVFTGLPKKSFTVSHDEKAITFSFKKTPHAEGHAQELIKENIKKYLNSKEIKFVES